jgi:Cu(I)/Ag(I) efflux system membrane protein CusA/SilA
MLSTGVRTPVGLKILGKDLAEIEKVGVSLEGLLARLRGTRSVFYERNEGGLYLDIVPNRDALARYGLTVGDVQRTVEAAIGGTPIGVTVEGRNRFSISVRYPQDLRGDVERIKSVLVPVGGGAPSGKMGALSPARVPALLLAQMSGGMGGTDATATSVRRLPRPIPGSLSDAPALEWDQAVSPIDQGTIAGLAGATSTRAQAFVLLGQVADVRIVGGPPMVRDEGGLLAGYVYVDLDPARDVGGYVAEAKRLVDEALSHGQLTLGHGTFLRWTGQYEQLEKMADRMRIVIPGTLLIIVALLFLHFRNFVEVLIVLLSIPFALVGSVWLLWLLDYRLSTAVWVGIIALVGLAAQTGVVMIVYIDNAYERRRRAGKIRDLSDIVWAHMEGTVQRVRPKLMTVGTMLMGLMPLLWASGSGADVMKRIAAPMVGGLVTSAFLTLEIIPVVYTYWRQEQLLWERLASAGPRRLARLRAWTHVLGAGWALLAATVVAALYVQLPRLAWGAALVPSAALVLVGSFAYLRQRPAARRLVWPERAAAAPRAA